MTVAPPTAKEQACMDALAEKFPASVLDPEDADFFDGSTYLCFARARNGDIEKASEMMEANIKWRKEMRPYAITSAEVEEAMKPLTVMCGGTCKAGRPVLIMTLGAPNDCAVEDRVKQLVYILELTRKKGYNDITWIVDFGEMGKHKKDERSNENRKTTMKIMQDNYPERMGLTVLYRPPWYVRMLLGVFKTFIDARTAKKIFLGGGKLEDLVKYVAIDQLPSCMGGGMPGGSLVTIENLPPYSKKGTGEVAAASEQPLSV